MKFVKCLFIFGEVLLSGSYFGGAVLLPVLLQGCCAGCVDCVQHEGT